MFQDGNLSGSNLMKNNHNIKIIFPIIFLFNNDFHLGEAGYYHLSNVVLHFIYIFQLNIFTGNGRIRFTTSLQIKYFRVNLSTYVYLYHLIVVS